MALPPSYRAFLQTSNGWRWPGAFVPRLWKVDEIDWLRTAAPNAIEIWSVGNSVLGEQLRGALRISEQEIGGTAVYLLLPELTTADGECEAWLFAHWIPGETRYRSFRGMMAGERQSFLRLEAENSRRVLPGEGPAQLAAKLPNLVAEVEGKAEQYREIARRQPVGSRFVGAGAAEALEEVAERVRRLQAQHLDPEALLASLRALQQEAAQAHRATQAPRRQKPSAAAWLRLAQGARGMARAEGLRQASGLIDWLIKDVGDILDRA